MIKRVLLIGDVGEKIRGYYHIGDEAMLYQNYMLYRNAGDFQISVQGWGAAPDDLRAAGYLIWESPVGKAGALQIESLVRRAEWQRRFPILPLSWRLMESIRLVRAHDLIHFSGGGNLNSLYPNELYARALMMRLARVYDKPVMATSQTLGPFDNQTDGEAFARAFDQLDVLTLRDRRESLSRAQKHLPHPCTRTTFDDAFFLEPIRPDALAPFWLPNGESVLRVGVSLHGDDESLAHAVTSALNRLAESYALQVYFIPHLVVADEQRHDVPYHRRLESKLDERIARRVITYRDLAEHSEPRKERLVKGITAAMDFVIATRYHALVFALSADVPALALNRDAYYVTKNLGLLEMLFEDRAQNFALTVAEASVERVMEKIRRLLSEHNAIQTQLRSKRAEFAPLRDQNVRIANGLIRDSRARAAKRSNA